MDGIFWQIDFTYELNQWINGLVVDYGDSLRQVSGFLLTYLLLPLEKFLMWLNPLVIILAVGMLTWFGCKKVSTTMLYMSLLYVIGCLGLWLQAIQTITIMAVSILIVMMLGLPLGIILAKSRVLSKVISPVLDAMQTFPMFVYMLPAVMLFSIGKVPAVIATVIYAFPPLVRLTELGILQVSQAAKEAATSFGASSWQMLVWIYLPLARPSIMTGINQTTMMALAMVVVASMIGARGLGEDVLYGITNLDFGRGFKSGVSIVIIAFLVDRISQVYGQSRRTKNMSKQNLVEDAI